MKMSKNLKILDKLVLIENVLCIYRNFSVMSKKTKILVSIRIVVEIILTITIFINIVRDVLTGKYSKEKAFSKFPVTFQVMSFLNSIAMISLGFYHSKIFVSLTRNIRYVHKVYLYNETLENMIKIIKIVWLFYGLFYVTSRIFITFTMFRTYVSHIDNLKIHFIVIGAIYESWFQIRWLIEFIMFFSVIYIVGSLFKILNESVKKTLKELEEKDHIEKTAATKVNGIKEWSIVYRHLLESCKQLNACFANQMLTSFSISLCYSIIISYRLASILIKQVKYEYFGGQQMVLSLCYQIVGIVPIMIIGQRLNNQYANLKISLAKMNNLLVTAYQSPEYKEVKDFLHFLNLDPLEFKLLSYPIGMALLPTSFGVIVSYVVIALQFNHVV